jgi:hypothetical protein
MHPNVCMKSSSRCSGTSEGVVIQFSPDSARGLQMRGRFQDQGGMFSYIDPEKRIPTNHPLRKIRELVRGVLKELNHIVPIAAIAATPASCQILDFPR